MRVLVVEDGSEYTTSFRELIGAPFEFVRAGSGREALEALGAGVFDLLFLDMRFDRATDLLGDLEALVERHNGDSARARRFLEDNQGAYVLAAIREAGHRQPAVMSYDFDGEPRRFENLSARYGPLAYLTDTAGPHEVRAALLQWGGAGSDGRA
jgi:CheY-like chemotaxis protein